MEVSLKKLFLTFLRIGLFTVGGGYVMIPMVKEYCIEKYHWVSETEFLNLIAIAESTPGPIAINMATFVGYRTKKLMGAITATLGVVLPSLIIMYVISLFFKSLFEYEIVKNFFVGARIAVSVLIFESGLRLFKDEQKDTTHKIINIIIYVGVIAIMIIPGFFSYEISAIEMMLILAIFSIIYAVIRVMRK